ncbi:MAG: 8-amino-7-oxononanoate synthase [Rhodospirillales bacterium 20-64-7]|nr:MAG: 8-amino-7-oxononanoate synthase [Rhodospirillales bacterium 20-64-7]HQT80437.1 aminotransferase class I/II-fold pyridoxal phosphate-dependent enzyme [Rhodopila sp.]
MSLRSTAFGLSQEAKSQLLERLANRRSTPSATPAATANGPARPPLGDPRVRDELRQVRKSGEILQIENPFFRPHDGIAGAETRIDGRPLLNLVSYNYLGLNGDPRVSAAAKDAIDQYGTSVSASRLVSGERPLHRALESALAALHGTEDCVAMVSGHATNVTTIGHLVGPGDAIVHDTLSHNSTVQGAILSGAQRKPFLHNDVADLQRVLRAVRSRVKRVLVVIEGHYSMDGDVPELPAIIDVVRQHDAYLMVDEAHSVGVLGRSGRGVAEHFGVPPSGVDVWMGTLSKTLSGCGGYIAASHDIVDYLRCSAPGFVYSVGLSPPVAAAALESLRLMQQEPWRIERLNAAARLFMEEARAAGLDTGSSIGAAIVPVILGSSIRAARVADHLFRQGVNVQPILYPAVPERSARLRFFLSALHTPDQIRTAVQKTTQAIAAVDRTKTDLVKLAALLG